MQTTARLHIRWKHLKRVPDGCATLLATSTPQESSSSENGVNASGISPQLCLQHSKHRSRPTRCSHRSVARHPVKAEAKMSMLAEMRGDLGSRLFTWTPHVCSRFDVPLAKKTFCVDCRHYSLGEGGTLSK